MCGFQKYIIVSSRGATIHSEERTVDMAGATMMACGGARTEKTYAREGAAHRLDDVTVTSHHH